MLAASSSVGLSLSLFHVPTSMLSDCVATHVKVGYVVHVLSVLCDGDPTGDRNSAKTLNLQHHRHHRKSTTRYIAACVCVCVCVCGGVAEALLGTA